MTDSTTPQTRRPLPQEVEAGALLEDAVAHLDAASQRLAGPAPAHAEALAESLRAVRQSLRALLAFHSLPAPEGATVAALWRPAAALASSLHTSAHRLLPLEALEAALRRGAPVTRATGEDVTLAFYLARNALLTVFAELPEAVRRPAAQRMGRLLNAAGVPPAPSGARTVRPQAGVPA